MPASRTCRRIEIESYPPEWSRKPKIRPKSHFLAIVSNPVLTEPDYPQDLWSDIIAQLKKPQPSPSPEERQFRKLADEWERETAFHSSLNKKVLHPAYQRIIGMGPIVIPMILREMSVKPGHWFWALDALTQGASPAKGCDNLIEATNAWIRWGEFKGFLGSIML
jgi:hypothetical protein